MTILSVSKRTDIPAFYSSWFFNRLAAGSAEVRYKTKAETVSLRPDDVDCIVFWTKNAVPMLPHIEAGELEKYKYYFQYTINAYQPDIEASVPSKAYKMIPAFKGLSQYCKCIWRYDPIFFNAKYTPAYHLKWFAWIAMQLAGHTDRCVVSFLDLYGKTVENTRGLGIHVPTYAEQHSLLQDMVKIASDNGIVIETCAEAGEFADIGVQHTHCIDQVLIESIIGRKLAIGKDPTQRKLCGCCQSFDVGAYNTCLHDCKYCYATTCKSAAIARYRQHDPNRAWL